MSPTNITSAAAIRMRWRCEVNIGRLAHKLRDDFAEEIVPLTAKSGKKAIEVTADEHPRPETTLDQLAKLKPAFRPGGTVTAGNSSGNQ